MKNHFSFSFLSSYVWMFPFLLFCTGYLITHALIKQHAFEAPLVVGLPLQEAVVLLSQKELNVRVVAQKEDSTLAANTVVHQKPAAFQMIKKQQTFFLITSKPSLTFTMPSIIGLQSDNIVQNCSFNLPIISLIPFNTTSGTCIAQIPKEGTILSSSTKIIAYCAQETEPLVIMPSLIGLSVEYASSLASLHGITTTFNHPYGDPVSLHQAVQYTIIEQRPLAGTFINLKKPPVIQCIVKP